MRTKSFIAGGTLLPDDLNKIQDDLDQGFHQWRDVMSGAHMYEAPGAGAVTLLPPSDVGRFASILPSDPFACLCVEYVDPADYAADPRTVMFRLRVVALENDASETDPMVVNLYPVSAVNGAGGAGTGVAVTLSSPALTVGVAAMTHNDRQHYLSAEASLGAGYYALGAVTPVTAFGSANTSIRAKLQVRAEG